MALNKEIKSHKIGVYKHNFYTLSHKVVSHIEEPYEGNLQVRFCEGHCLGLQHTFTPEQSDVYEERRVLYSDGVYRGTSSTLVKYGTYRYEHNIVKAKLRAKRDKK